GEGYPRRARELLGQDLVGRIWIHAKALGEVAPLLLEPQRGDRGHAHSLRGLGCPLATALVWRCGGFGDPLGTELYAPEKPHDSIGEAGDRVDRMHEHVDGGSDRARDGLARSLGELLGLAEVVE